ncbi:O-methyltransferase [Peribacillus sp. SCS-155]|uniref:O-methyltransferase n=1 Tax=Peribacillus sedimenti TaxID=3115297 RepID=UPI0039065BD9
MKDKIEEYLHSLLPSRSGLLADIEQFAKEHNVPIMEPEGIEVLLQVLRLQNPKSILEVGTAIGYSALRMSEAVPNANIVTIERDEDRISTAKQNFERAAKTDKIRLVEGDALEQAGTVAAYGPFDAIFIDAAKGQYKRFFELYEEHLSNNGIIITDNVLFKGLVAEEEETIEPKRIRSMVKKIKDYNGWLMEHPHYHTVIMPIGDGVAISKRK